jgi:HK97 gp10 family phage protein
MGVKVVRRTRIGGMMQATSDHMREVIERQVAGGIETFQQLAPYDESNTSPGHVHMRDSAKVVPIEQPDGGVKVSVTLEAEHAIFPEYGTVDQDAQPSFRPAMDSVARGIREEMKIVPGAEVTTTHG